MEVVFVLGGPGAGKSTQCAQIIQHHSYTHLSAGELLRNERQRSDSKFSGAIDSCFKQGRFAPAEVTVHLLKKAMENTTRSDENKSHFLIDGFPVDKENMECWTRAMDGKADVQFILFLDCSDEVCIQRCLERGKDSGRDDDNKDSLERRIRMYLQSTRPVIERYKQRGKVHTVDASPAADQVFAEVKKIFDREG